MKERTRLMAITNYSDNLGNGQVVATSSFDQDEWTPVGLLEPPLSPWRIGK